MQVRVISLKRWSWFIRKENNILKDLDKLIKLDKEITLCQERIDDQASIEKHLIEVAEKISELEISAYDLKKEHDQLLKEYDRLAKYNLPDILSKFINANIEERQAILSQEYLQTSLLHASILQELEIRQYEKRILEKKAQSIYSDKMQLQLLVDKKENIIQSNIRLKLSKYSNFTFRANSFQREIKYVQSLLDDSTQILASLDSLRLAIKEITFSISSAFNSFQKFYPTYYQSKKMKWIARKSIELKLELTRFLSHISNHIEKEEYQEIQSQSDQYIFQYIKTLIADLRSASISNAEVDKFFQNINILLTKSQLKLKSVLYKYEKELNQVLENKRTWIIDFKNE